MMGFSKLIWRVPGKIRGVNRVLVVYTTRTLIETVAIVRGRYKIGGEETSVTIHL